MLLREKSTEEADYITLKFDLLFKKVFGDYKDLIPIKYLLKNILNIDVNEVKILNSELIGRPYRDKNVQVDLVVELESGTKVSVEINTNVSQEYIDRNLFYMCRNISKDLKPGIRHKKLNRHIQINMDYNGRHVKPIEKYSFIEEEEGEKLTNMLEIIRVDIPYFSDKCYNEDVSKLDSLTKLIGLFDVKELEFAKSLCKGDKNMEDIMDRIEKYNDDEDVIGAYDYEEKMELISKIREEEAIKTGTEKGLKEGFETGLQQGHQEGFKLGMDEGLEKGLNQGLEQGLLQGIEKGIEQGIKKGLNQRSIEIAKNMLKENIDINVISKVTNLGIEEINNLHD